MQNLINKKKTYLQAKALNKEEHGVNNLKMKARE
jgi:hypothetical protein